MTIYKGNKKIGQINKGNKLIKLIYKGNKLVYGYKPGTILLETNVADTYTVKIKYPCTIHAILIGGGGGGCHVQYIAVIGQANGGSAAYVEGTIKVSPGTYTIIVGRGGNAVSAGAWENWAESGYNTTGFGCTAGGGGGAGAYAALNGSWGTPGSGGGFVTASGFTGQNGGAGNTSGWINYYGAGGLANPTNGQNGYVKIEVI